MKKVIVENEEKNQRIDAYLAKNMKICPELQ